MRKNSARKWLHATLDLLPVVIIPIFALYATNKNATFAQEITVSQNKVVDFNQIINIDSWRNSSLQYTFNSNGTITVINIEDFNLEFPKIYSFDSSNLIENHHYAINKLGETVDIRFWGTTDNVTYYDTVEIVNLPSDINGLIDCYLIDTLIPNATFTFSPEMFDLTKMFGVGNEPSITQFKQWYPNAYYDYTLSEKQLLKDYDQITYNDTDIGSQFIYGLYNSVDKYFNIGNVFNLGSIYDWFNLNIFNGNSPIVIYVVWNIVAYEFLMDLLFLLYGLFMFFIDTCTNLMDRFYCNLSGRR